MSTCRRNHIHTTAIAYITDGKCLTFFRKSRAFPKKSFRLCTQRITRGLCTYVRLRLLGCRLPELIRAYPGLVRWGTHYITSVGRALYDQDRERYRLTCTQHINSSTHTLGDLQSHVHRTSVTGCSRGLLDFVGFCWIRRTEGGGRWQCRCTQHISGSGYAPSHEAAFDEDLYLRYSGAGISDVGCSRI